MKEIRGKCAYICIYIYIREGDFRGEEDTDDGVGSLIGGNNDAFCETTDWGHWSECSSTCGVGMKLRTRRFKDRMGRKRCPHVSLVEKVKCMEPPCSSGLEEQIDPTCKVFFTRVSSIPLQFLAFLYKFLDTLFGKSRKLVSQVTDWSDWSPCSASCGKGVKLRTRLLMVDPSKQQECSSKMELVQQRPCLDQADCTFDMATAKGLFFFYDEF